MRDPVLVIAAIWGLGGFERRTDLLGNVAPGTLITTGPYGSASPRPLPRAKNDTTGAITGWEIVMIGEAHTTEDTSVSLDALDNVGMLVSKDDVSSGITVPYSTNHARDQSYERNQLAPGLPLIAYTVTALTHPERGEVSRRCPADRGRRGPSAGPFSMTAHPGSGS